jgi:hypothetical protein
MQRISYTNTHPNWNVTWKWPSCTEISIDSSAKDAQHRTRADGAQVTPPTSIVQPWCMFFPQNTHRVSPEHRSHPTRAEAQVTPTPEMYTARTCSLHRTHSGGHLSSTPPRKGVSLLELSHLSLPIKGNEITRATHWLRVISLPQPGHKSYTTREATSVTETSPCDKTAFRAKCERSKTRLQHITATVNRSCPE